MALTVYFSGAALPGLFVTLGFGRRLLGLVLPEVLAFSLGRDVRNAPRTSSWSCGAGAAVPTTTAHAQIIAKRSTLKRIKLSPSCAEYGFQKLLDCSFAPTAL